MAQAERHKQDGSHSFVQAQNRAREVNALEARLAGYLPREIAVTLGCSERTVYNMINRALDRTVAEPAADVRRMELDRLDVMLRVLWPRVLHSDLGAIDRVLRVMERRSRLLGLDAPARLDIGSLVREVATEHGLSEEERREVDREVKAYLASQRHEHAGLS